MNLLFVGKILMVLSAFSLISFGLHPYVNSLLGLEESIFNSVWQLLAISIGLSILGGFAYPHFRGVRRGDALIAEVPRTRSMGNSLFAFIESAPVTAIEEGRLGQKIRVRFVNGKSGEGVIAGYSSTFSPGMIRITETEV